MHCLAIFFISKILWIASFLLYFFLTKMCWVIAGWFHRAALKLTDPVPYPPCWLKITCSSVLIYTSNFLAITFNLIFFVLNKTKYNTNHDEQKRQAVELALEKMYSYVTIFYIFTSSLFSVVRYDLLFCCYFSGLIVIVLLLEVTYTNIYSGTDNNILHSTNMYIKIDVHKSKQDHERRKYWIYHAIQNVRHDP